MTPGMMLLAVPLIAVGGAVGAVLRWGLLEAGRALARRRGSSEERTLPWCTFAANSLACFVLGISVALLGSATGGGHLLYLLLYMGVCGALSTLSTAALDLVRLVRGGTPAIGVAYLLLSIGSGMGMLWLGLVIAS